MALEIRRAASPLRTELFTSQLRDETDSISVQYSGTAADPRIDAAALDYFDAKRGFFGASFHYVIKIDGTIEVARNPRSRTARTRNYAARSRAIHVAVVGGYNAETGRRLHTTTNAQEAALEALYQLLADTLGVPLTIYDGRENWVIEHRKPQDGPGAG